MAVETKAASDVEWQHYSIAFVDAAHGFTNLFDDTHDFVPDHSALLQFGAAVVHVKIAAANAACGHLQNCICRRV